MDESSGGFSVAGEWTTHAAREVVASASGKLWSIVDARELRNVLGQLIASAEPIRRCRCCRRCAERPAQRVKKLFFGGMGGGPRTTGGGGGGLALCGGSGTFFSVTRSD